MLLKALEFHYIDYKYFYYKQQSFKINSIEETKSIKFKFCIPQMTTIVTTSI